MAITHYLMVESFLLIILTILGILILKSLEKTYLKRQITVSRYINCSRQDLTDLFLNINDSFTLNQQEKRNAILVLILLGKKTYKINI